MEAFLEWLTSRTQPGLDWPEALVTLTFRFFAVFIVLWVIQLGMQLSAYLIRRFERGDSAPAATPERTARGTDGSANGAAKQPDEGALDDATIAAIGLALELESQPEAVSIAYERQTSAWAMAGRARQLRFK